MPKLVHYPMDLAPPGRTSIETSSEETLVVDVRGKLTPAQMVEQKLIALLEGDSRGIPYSEVGYERFADGR